MKEEIGIEHKKPTRLWLGVGVIITVVVLVWILAFANNGRNTDSRDKMDQYNHSQGN